MTTATSTYNLLKNKVDQAQRNVSDAQDALTKANNQPRYIAIKAEIAKGNAGSASDPTWLANVQHELDVFEGAIETAKITLQNARVQLTQAIATLTDYENSSPTIKAQIESQEQRTKLLKIGGVLLVISVIAGIIIFVVRRKKKKTT